MALTEQLKLFLGVLDDGQIELRRTRVVLDNATTPPELVAEKHHRQVLEPGQDVTVFPPKVRSVCAAVWTPAVISAYLAAKAAREADSVRSIVAPAAPAVSVTSASVAPAPRRRTRTRTVKP